MRSKGTNDSIPTRQESSNEDGPLYVSFAGNSRASALRQHRLHDDPIVVHEMSTAAWPGAGYDAGPRPGSPSVRAGFNRWDRDYWRPEETLPVQYQDIIRACQAIYRRIGFIRNVVDLMADFASEGLELNHPVRSQQQFFRAWAKKVNLQGRCHDFMKLMLRDANVIVRRKMAKIDLGTSRDMSKGVEAPEVVKKKRDRKQPDRTIPWKYVFFSPTIVEKVGGEVGKFFGGETVAIKLPAKLASSINNPKTPAEKEMVAKLPDEVRAAAKAKNKLMVLDPSRIFVSHYKKDDWEDWAIPFLYGILDDVMFKDKMRQADIAALDGVINVIRVWKLGDHTKEILPSKAAVNKLISILENNTGGGVLDLVWDSMLDLKVEYPPTDKILGPEKYTSVDADIVRGLGIPDVLLGGAGGAKNAQTGFMQLKTVTQRLQYVRERTTEWLMAELQIVADAMGYTPPTVEYGTMALRDEAAEKALIIQLLDRGVISIETVVKAFGHDFVVELERMREEQQIRDKEPPILEKADPYHRPFSLIDKQTESQIKVVEAQGKVQAKMGGGGGTDNQNGDQPRKDGTPSGPGRPAKTPSPKPRDQRTPKTLSTVYQGMAEDILEAIDDVIDPIYLDAHKIGNVRQASAEQRKELEQIKWATLCCVRPGDPITAEKLGELVEKSDTSMLATFEETLRDLTGDFERVMAKKPTVRDRRRLMASAWAIVVTE